MDATRGMGRAAGGAAGRERDQGSLRKKQFQLVMLCLWLGLVTAPGAEPARGTYGRIPNREAVWRERMAAHGMERFVAWVDRAGGDPGARREAWLQEGVALARARRIELKTLLRERPEAALELAIPAALRSRLPENLAAELEEEVSGRGFFGVLCTLGSEPEGEGHRHGMEISRRVHLQGKEYEAHVFGRRLVQTTRENIPLHGIVIDGAMALSEDPVRVVEAGSPPRQGGPLSSMSHDCAVCGLALAGVPSALEADVGGRTVGVCTEEHLVALNQQWVAAESGDQPGGGGLVTADSAWTEGVKQVLLIRVDFDDLAGEPVTEANALALLNTRGSLFFSENSYGKTTLEATVTPVLRMPKSSLYYKTNDAYTLLMSDARAASAAAGYDPAPYQLDIIGFKSLFSGWSGRGYVGGKGTWINGEFSDRVAFHELGHNYGLWHANLWNATGDTVIGPGTAEEYGDHFDAMGVYGGTNLHFNAWYKSLLGWLGTTDWTTVTESGTYRVYAQDNPSVASGQLRFLRILNPRDTSRHYSVEFRQKNTANRWLMHGVQLHWILEANSSTGSRLLDTAPGTADGRTDHPILFGRTFSDLAAGIHITPVRKSGTVPEAAEIVVHLGTFPENRAPTAMLSASATTVATGVAIRLDATASDPDGDPLAFGWDFGDRNFGPNASTVTPSWSAAGRYVVRCVVSDMKGGTATDYVVVTVGAPTTYTVSGTIRTAAGWPVGGVRVHNGLAAGDAKYRTTWTAEDGSYVLPNLAAGTYTVTAVKPGHTLWATGFTNPLSVAGHVTAADFDVMPVLWTLRGRVTDGGAGVPSAQVQGGNWTSFTDVGGYFAASNLVLGSYTVTATKPGYTLTPSGFSNPVIVDFASVSNVNFIHNPVTYTLSGEILGVGTTVVTVTDGYRTATSRRSGSRNVFTLPGVPAGQWTLRATTTSQSFEPSNFTNPLQVGADRGGLQFTVQTTRTYSVSGTITNTLGEGLAGVSVQAADTMILTDSRGGYYLANLASGTVTLIPTLSGYAFSPSSREVVISEASVTAQHFTGTSTELPQVNLLAVVPETTEGGPVPGRFRISRTGALDRGLTVRLLRSGEASNGYDFDVLPDFVDIPAGAAAVDLLVSSVDDTAPECVEHVVLALVAQPAYLLGNTASDAVRIVDNDTPAITLVPSALEVAEFGVTQLDIQVVRSGCTAQSLTVPLAMSGTATAGSDYLFSATAEIPAGKDRVCLTLNVVPDGQAEGDETLQLDLGPGVGYTAAEPGPVTLLIRDRPWEAWRVARFGAQANDPGVAGETADPDADGYSNLEEYVFGTDPHGGENTGAPKAYFDARVLTVELRRLASPSDAMVQLQVAGEVAGPWNDATQVEVVATEGPYEWLRVTDESLPGRVRGFVRARVSLR